MERSPRKRSSIEPSELWMSTEPPNRTDTWLRVALFVALVAWFVLGIVLGAARASAEDPPAARAPCVAHH